MLLNTNFQELPVNGKRKQRKKITRGLPVTEVEEAA